jgi:hypothetical protein
MIMRMWRELWKAVFEASQLWWWRVATFVVLPVSLILRFTHAVTGWPATALNLLWVGALVSVWIVALARLRREHSQQGSPSSRHPDRDGRHV